MYEASVLHKNLNHNVKFFGRFKCRMQLMESDDNVPFVFTSSCLQEGSCLVYVICVTSPTFILWTYVSDTLFNLVFHDNRYIQQIVHGTEGHMAVYGPVRHQKNSIWTEACPYNIFLVTDRSIYCHMTRSDMNYLLYYTFYLK